MYAITVDIDLAFSGNFLRIMSFKNVDFLSHLAIIKQIRLFYPRVRFLSPTTPLEYTFVASTNLIMICPHKNQRRNILLMHHQDNV